MTSPLLLVASLLAPAMLSCAPRQDAMPIVRLVEYGVIRPVGPFVQRSDPTAAAGFTSHGTGNSVFEQRTTEIPAALGAAFGIRYRIENIREGQAVLVEEIVHYPPMTRPNGTVVTEERTKDLVTSETGYIDQKFFYRLGQPYEIVAGEWTLSVSVNGVRAIEQRFSLRAPK
ncbi:MAG: DUF3859 domain-containing protein [Acidobacteriota bacterium]